MGYSLPMRGRDILDVVKVPTEVGVATTAFKALVVLTPPDALTLGGELLTAAAAQTRKKTQWTKTPKGYGHDHS